MNAIKRVLCCLLCAGLLLMPLCGSGESSKVPDTAPEVRVLLRRLGLTDRIDLTLTGRYLLRAGETEMLFSESARIILQIREGTIYLICNEVTMPLGKSVSLLRQRGANSSPFLRFGSAAAAYPGDLSITIKDGQFRAVLTLSMENYLLGVVPYEMSEYFPLEALKVQAICARTYALSRLNPQRDYDVVDTTDDQVFRGITEDTPKCTQAVRETDGLVITDGKRLIPAYYSASNGGQTEIPEHAWSGHDHYSCFAIKDDPYDMENPESLTRTTVLKKDGSSIPKGFLGLLRENVLAEPEMAGFSADEGAFRVDGIESIELTDPLYGAPSRVMTKVKITVRVSGRKILEEPDLHWEPEPGETGTAPEEAPEVKLSDFMSAGTYTLELPLLPKAAILLGMSISGTGNEIITVTEDETAFTMVSGRYGHGVGMSQRGAQWMAGKYGKTCEEILDFYYPGMVLKQYSSGIAEVPTPPPLLAQTPGPAATPTPRPTLMPVTVDDLPEGSWIASVEGIEDDSTLNLRSIPSPGGSILTRLYKHQRLLVLEDDEIPGWAHVRTDAIEGYVMTSFLERVEE